MPDLFIKHLKFCQVQDPAFPLHEWHAHMLPCPDWLPGLDQGMHEKKRLKKLYKETLAEYECYIGPKGSTDLECSVMCNY